MAPNEDEVTVEEGYSISRVELPITEEMIEQAQAEMSEAQTLHGYTYTGITLDEATEVSTAIDPATLVGADPHQILQRESSLFDSVPDESLIRSRQTDLVDSSIFENPISVVGAGAIGSFTVLTLAKMGFRQFAVYDHDRVNDENISNQFYRYRDRGTNKVEALRGMIRDFENINISTYPVRWDTTSRLNGYVIMAVDSMEVRNQIYRFIKRNSDVYGFIDGRMGGQQAEVYSVDLLQPEHKQVYEQYLWSDTEAEELPCTQKAVMYNVLWIASQIANNLRLMLEDKPFQQVMLMDFNNSNHMNIQHNVE